MLGKTMVLMQAKVDELNEATPTPAPTGASIQEGVSTVDSFLQLIGLVFILIIILVAAYYTSKFVGRVTLGQLKNSNFHVIDTYRISQNKFLQIVKVGNKFIVLAIGKDTINFITELEESEVFLRDVHMGDKPNFKQILEKLRNNKE